MTRIVFMGSPDFAVPSLKALARAHRVVGVVTQPDRPAGRGSLLRPPSVKVVAQALGLPLYQPRSLRDPEAQDHLTAWGPEVIVVAAFGQILPPAVLDLPPHGCVNLHASLLPRWRGAAPIAAAILAGDEITGVTVMRMDAGVDTGPILARREEPIRPDDTTDTLSERLARLAADLIVETLPPYLAGALLPQPQPEEGVTHCRMLKKEDGWLDWTRPAVELDRRVRAMTPWPGAFTTWWGQRLKVLRAIPLPDWRGSESPGTVIPLGDGAAVVTGEGALRLLEVQRAGKKALPIAAFLHGRPDFLGAVLGER
ncbi:MAG TPA: methionyl-tRNA formyltransferase [Anaerolineales bacterium]|nr:methionyl-tRNA formyltransferase [Anaerolineae bacterium]HIQ01963.1 methionyl-tRNA formyltransferase [Anaerolineales bacterium]